jgi:hypothetical protein
MNSQVLPQDIIEKLRQHHFGVLATNSRESPYTSLITIDVSSDCRYLIFPTLRESRKYKNLFIDPHVSVMLDNRSVSGKNLKTLYALTVLGTAHEVDERMYSSCKKQFLLHHSHLSDFLSLPQTALIQVTFTKLVLVEEFQNLREFDCLPQV